MNSKPLGYILTRPDGTPIAFAMQDASGRTSLIDLYLSDQAARERATAAGLISSDFKVTRVFAQLQVSNASGIVLPGMKVTAYVDGCGDEAVVRIVHNNGAQVTFTSGYLSGQSRMCSWDAIEIRFAADGSVPMTDDPSLAHQPISLAAQAA